MALVECLLAGINAYWQFCPFRLRWLIRHTQHMVSLGSRTILESFHLPRLVRVRLGILLYLVQQYRMVGCERLLMFRLQLLQNEQQFLLLNEVLGQKLQVLLTLLLLTMFLLL